MSSTKDEPKIVYGTKSLLGPEPYDPSELRIRISMMIQGDVLKAIRAEAAKQKKPYQTLIQEVLRREFVGGGDSELQDAVAVVKELADVIRKNGAPWAASEPKLLMGKGKTRKSRKKTGI